jgi:putative addiction module component (TIGR02574 family)
VKCECRWWEGWEHPAAGAALRLREPRAALRFPFMTSPAFDFETLRRLSVAERIQLVEDLWDSIAADAPDEAFPLTPELAGELDREVEAHERDPGSAVPWEQVRAEILDPTRRRER